MCFPGFPNLPGFSCSFQRTTETDDSGEDNASSTSNQSPLVTTQSGATQKQSKTKTEVKITLGNQPPTNNEDGATGGVEGHAQQIQTIVATTQSIINNPQVQKGCKVCYDHCNDPCINRCGCFGSWFCACFKACCVIEVDMDTNIPEIIKDMDSKYGPLCLAMSLQHLGWDVLTMSKQGIYLSTQQESQLEEECKKAKERLAGSFNYLSQERFYTTSIEIPGDKELENVLPTLLKIMGDKAWKDPSFKPNPPTCWVLEPSEKTDASSPTSAQPRFSLQGPSLFASANTNMTYDHATGTKYKQKKMTKLLSSLEVLSLQTGAIGTLGAKEAHLVTTIFKIFLCLIAGEHSPIVQSGGCVCYDINRFVKLFMMILLCCGYVPVDKDGKTTVNYDDDDDDCVKIYRKSLRIYNQSQRGSNEDTVDMATMDPAGAAGGPIVQQPTKLPKRHELLRQGSIRTPTGDHDPEDDWLKQMIDGDDGDDDDDGGIAQQRGLIDSSSALDKVFSAMRRFNEGI
ncbi:hypothetical protein O1W69_03640 [Chlamydia sp. 12-01]|uniref:hypothetical protein n=1 Tax=Chlamydia sp. 12-01 TaxID=3002742 RepID=UPI0035D4B171